MVEQLKSRHFPNRKIPYHGNPDNKSCAQCVYKMILEYFLSGQEWSFERMNELCDVEEGKWTWNYAAMNNLSNMGFHIVHYDHYDDDKFLEDPMAYMIGHMGEENAIKAYNNSNMDRIVEAVRNYVDLKKSGEIERYNERYEEDILKNLVNSGYLICTWVNSRILNNMDGFNGHFILIHDYDENGFYAHDPGGLKDGKPNNQIENRYIQAEDLIKAASSNRPYGEVSDIIAVKLDH